MSAVGILFIRRVRWPRSEYTHVLSHTVTKPKPHFQNEFGRVLRASKGKTRTAFRPELKAAIPNAMFFQSVGVDAAR